MIKINLMDRVNDIFINTVWDESGTLTNQGLLVKDVLVSKFIVIITASRKTAKIGYEN